MIALQTRASFSSVHTVWPITLLGHWSTCTSSCTNIYEGSDVTRDGPGEERLLLYYNAQLGPTL